MSYNYPKEPFVAKVKRLVKMSLRALHYLRLPQKKAISNVVCFIIDPSMKHLGFADRLKAIVNTYYIAKKSGLGFKLYFNHPFALSKYLVPNKVDWEMQMSDLDCSLFSSHLAAYTAEFPMPILKRGQYHVYWYRGIDMLLNIWRLKTDDKEIVQKEWSKTFKECYDELFKPSEYLDKLLASTNMEKRAYVSVHFRFVNALGYFEDAGTRYPVLSEEKQKQLIADCLDSLQRIREKHQGLPIYVFSDSEKFVGICVAKGYHRILGGKIGHVSFADSESSVDKAMLDFFTMSRSEKVYAVLLPHMYGSVFSQYAAAVGGADFERIRG